jgi:vacuolar-type H+-ATPase subunit I/STV1
MGAFIWHQWAQYVAIFASVYTVWAASWGLFYRKFFWDFVNGTNMPGPNNFNNGRKCFDDNPCGIVPAPQDAIFVDIIVRIPIVQIITLIFGMTHLMLELVPQIRQTAAYRSFVLRSVTYTLQAFFAVLFYQGTNAAVYTFTAVIGFVVAQVKGEEWEEAKENRGTTGKA